MSSREELLAREAIRVYQRYAVEIVEGLGFCPYARMAREEGRVRVAPVLEPLPTDEAMLRRIDALGEDADVEIALLIFPRLTLSRPKLGRWVEVLRKAHAAASGGTPVMAIEGFHPDAEAETSSADRLTPFVRRTPDPTLQLTRLEALERVRRGKPQGTAFFDPAQMDLQALLEQETPRPLHEQIAQANLRTVVELSVPEVRARMDDILRDRDEAYARIDPSLPRRLPV